MREPTYDQCLVDAELRARAAYAEPHRHYHDERHLDECLAELDSVHGLEEGERRLLRWALLWHDAIYEPGRRNNEIRSARLAEQELLRCKVPREDAAEVARLIRATERHKVESEDRLGALVVSIDLSVLGSDPQRYREYVADVRLEYAHVPEQLWRTGRTLVLQRLLEADPLFPDRNFRERLEAQARANMEAEIRDLVEG